MRTSRGLRMGVSLPSSATGRSWSWIPTATPSAWSASPDTPGSLGGPGAESPTCATTGSSGAPLGPTDHAAPRSPATTTMSCGHHNPVVSPTPPTPGCECRSGQPDPTAPTPGWSSAQSRCAASPSTRPSPGHRTAQNWWRWSPKVTSSISARDTPKPSPGSKGRPTSRDRPGSPHLPPPRPSNDEAARTNRRTDQADVNARQMVIDTIPRRLERIVANLVGNPVTHAGTAVRARIAHDPSGGLVEVTDRAGDHARGTRERVRPLL